jgi:hypothetical protein
MDTDTTTTSLSGTEAITGAPAADGSVAAGTTTEEVVEVKDLMKSVLGKEFPDNEAAIKSLKDTYAYVGQMGQKVNTLEKDLEAAKQNEAPADLAQQVQSLQAQVKEANFYAANPQYNTAESKALIQKFGGSPEDVVKDEVFQKAFTALKTTAEMEQSQSVLHSNPRLGTAQDTMTKAIEAQKAGNHEEAFANATSAVLDAYGMK